jgi:GH15 family glucan-1,4-alpha-glucosidase
VSPQEKQEDKPQSAAMPSPFPPIAEYAFLSDCHTGALVAPDGSVEWLCIPRFDSPSIFGSLLDREAGAFRFGPFDINVPNARSYEPGTNTLITTWHTPTGWAVVRDALTMSPHDGEEIADRRERQERLRPEGVDKVGIIQTVFQPVRQDLLAVLRTQRPQHPAP